MTPRKTDTVAKKASSGASRKKAQGKAESTSEAIARRAFEIWDSSGRPQGREVEHWLQAEKELGKS